MAVPKRRPARSNLSAGILAYALERDHAVFARLPGVRGALRPKSVSRGPVIDL
jgi:hypothetical protein